tara:strand:+ start:1285 stop:2139 length:855 start_codon:yes stop_codon:yes gene_type:complete
MKAIAAGFMAGLGLLAVPLTEARAAESQADDVTLAKRESVQLEFETERGLAYQVFSKIGEGDWQPLGQVIEGDGKLATVSYSGESDGVEFRVETYERAGPLSLPEGIDYKLTGIYRLRGEYRVCVAKVDRTTEPVRTAHFTLVEGDAGGLLRLLSVDAAAGRVRIEAGGVSLSLSLAGDTFQTATAKPQAQPQPAAGKPTIITAPPKGKVFMAAREPYYKAVQKQKQYTNRYSLLEKPTVKAINRSIRIRPQSIFTPRVSVPGYRIPTHYRPSSRYTKFSIRRR